MSLILVDLARESHDLQCNGWNWRPTVELIRRSGLIDSDRLERMTCSGIGGQVTAEEARAIALFLGTEILPRLKDDEMIHMDGGVSKQPQSPRPIVGTDPYELYAARKSWVESFVTFCKESGGFKVC